MKNNKNNKKAVLVTGGAGFIGSNIAEKLLELEEKVIVFDNLSTGKKENIEGFFKNPNFKFIQGDIRNQKELEEIMPAVDHILHQAALPSVIHSIKEPKSTFENNALGTLNLLMAAKKYKIKKVVYASSSSIYGTKGNLPKEEGMVPNPISPYGLSKLTGEKLCQIFSEIYGIPTICLRYFNVFGPKQDPISEYAAVIPKFIKAFLDNERPMVFGDGKQTRDFTFIDNVVEANLKALYCEFNKGKVCNIACGKQTSLLEVIDILNEIFGKKNKPIFEKERSGDIKYSYADISEAKKILGYNPRISLKEGLKKTIDWFRVNLKL